VKKAWQDVEHPSAQDEEFTEAFEVNGSVLYNTNIIVITVTGPDPALVQQLAIAISEQTIDYVTRLYEIYDLKPLDAAELPEDPVSPSLPLNLILGSVLGLGAGVFFAFLTEYLRAPVTLEVRASDGADREALPEDSASRDRGGKAE
jgi:capsular polysaccharide biosynthesis protein